MTFYRINKNDVKNRIRIGSIPTDSMQYYHSFGHTKDYLLMPKNSVTFSVMGMAQGKSIKDCFVMNYDNHLEFMLMRIDDGTYKTFKTDHGAMIVHTGASYIENDIYTIDFEMYVNKDQNPFGLFDMSWLMDSSREAITMGSVYRRY